jgi:hypothetical protein
MQALGKDEKLVIYCNDIRDFHRMMFSMHFHIQWAYGVTLWEMYSGGTTPHAGIQVAELLQKFRNGYRMEKPLNRACTEDM